ncbi:MAG: UbiA family prenyltransferase [Calditrichaeota bacterium]|nr:UbiA family prenyltransferase [Calditrichota bacterium]
MKRNDEQTIDERISSVLNEADRMMLATSVDGNSSAASVFFARDGNDLLFFTFNPTRKAEQIRMNPYVQAVILPRDQEGIRGLQIEGRCRRITDAREIQRAKELILKATTAFQEFMEDPFLIKNKVVGYYRIKPTLIKYVDFYSDEKFEYREFPENRVSVVKDALQTIGRRFLLWIRAVRAPFFSATIVPVLLGAVIAYGDLHKAGLSLLWSWKLFWLTLIGGLFAQAGTNLGNDYFDHTSRNDEFNKSFSPFNGGSRIIQAGLLKPWKVFMAAVLAFGFTIGIGLYLNFQITGNPFGNSLLLWIGFLGVALGAFYTWNPLRLGYRGLGEISIALGFGPVMVLGAHFVLTQPLTHNDLSLWLWQKPLLASVPVAILIMLVVWINQFQDVPADAKAGKRTWVVRLAKIQNDRILYEGPFAYYVFFNIISFGFIVLMAVLGVFKPQFSTPFIIIATLPALLVLKAVKWGKEWLELWNMPEADRTRLPYELLKVNVSTVGVHLFTGSLIILAFWLSNQF